ncbi:chaperone NapD [Bradyrhizobium roseum]|uniref:chaperone NapD n=1 Tax=Bradyrhizobium roseum TaxID=3056648 RepID=UPI00261E2618|nr:chaperone NapD [Bradyrhizobium roseus]WKA27612.1 chaperone NapD [Bradyrhizobium roseus]
MANSQNICGVAVYLAPGAGADLTARIQALPGVELQAASGEQRLAATVVDTPTSMAIDQIAAIHRMPGVVAASLIFHAVDEADGGAEPFDDNPCEDNAACGAGTGHRVSTGPTEIR